MQEGSASTIAIIMPTGQVNSQDDSNHTSNTSSSTVVLRPEDQALQINQEAFFELDWWSTRTNLLIGKKIQ